MTYTRNIQHMQIRQFTPGDEQAVIEFWQKCNLIRSWNNPDLDIERKLKDSPDLFFTGTFNDEIVASVMAGYDGHRGWIYYLAVDPEYRRNGYGRQIMAFAEEKLKDIGCPKINLMVRKSNREVIRFYEKTGYSEDDVVTMSRRLIEEEPYNG